MDKTKAAALFMVVASLMASGLYVQGMDKVYYCGERQIAFQCNDLSKINADGLQTRCYFTEGKKETFKTCNDGWIKFENQDIVQRNDLIFLCEKKTELIQECISDKEQELIKVSYFE